MSRNRGLTDLKNIGKKIASRLNEIGVFSEDELRHVGAVGAHQMIKEKYPEETLPVCYYLYSFEGALIDKHWNEIGEEKRSSLNHKSANNHMHSDSKKRRSFLALLLAAGDVRR